MTFTPIGVFRGGGTYKYEAPRQGVFGGVEGVVELLPGHNFETALRDLDGFDRVWLLFVFDRNGRGWRPTTRPPVPGAGRARVGVFASRAPYRPNPIGLSCVRLLAVQGRTLRVAEADLLDNTPILDIKPYIPAADAFPGARAGWVETPAHDDVWSVSKSPLFSEQADFVRDHAGFDLARAARLQLARDPLDASRKRVSSPAPRTGVLAVRMFRIHFSLAPAAHTVTLEKIVSGYSPDDLVDPHDPYADKALHRLFCSTWLGAPG